MAACSKGSNDVINFLIGKGANDWHSAIIIARNYNFPDIVVMLQNCANGCMTKGLRN
jgi:hypothetical protein